ncbi:MAG TPA: hypothetical protein DEF92_08150, partial [Leclercia adecarboxylata]|nr:LacI family DNA-binding transcriptional regulator [Escherichia coli]MBX4288646.1 LacI family DNA-binding transcriptional regulator [Mycobacterium tuberculosis]MBZ2343896.1 LacI family DNA-binding transcriptional regulator [Escherichia coli]HBX12749.1 hypothetical protein [Leclercia adecarboxylata]
MATIKDVARLAGVSV